MDATAPSNGFHLSESARRQAGTTEQLSTRRNLNEEPGSDMETGSSSDAFSSAVDYDSNPQVAPPQPPSNSRTTVLYEGAKSFTSSDEFFESCRNELFNQYGVPAHRYSKSEQVAIATCKYRKERCPFLILAEKAHGVWNINQDKSKWTHKHDAGRPSGPNNGSAREITSDESSSSESVDEPLARQSASAKPVKPSGSTDVEDPDLLFILSKREEILEKQRSLAGSVRQAMSQVVVQAELDSLKAHAKGRDKPSGVREHERYLEWTRNANIPPYPAAWSVLALYVLDRFSHNNLTTGHTKACLRRLHLALEDTWDDCDTYKDLNKFGSADDAIARYFLQRAKLPAKLPAKFWVYTADERAVPSDDSDSSSDRGSGDREWPSRGNTRARDHSQAGPSSSESDSAEETEESEPEQSARRTAMKPAHLMVPGTPTVGQEFKSKIDAYRHCAVLNLNALAINVALVGNKLFCGRQHKHYAKNGPGTCDWVLDLEANGSRIVVGPGSSLFHNHGPAAARLANPKWLPLIKNPHAREAMGLPSLNAKPQEKLRDEATDHKKRKRHKKRARLEIHAPQLMNPSPPRDTSTSLLQSSRQHDGAPEIMPAETRSTPNLPSRPVAAAVPSNHHLARSVVLAAAGPCQDPSTFLGPLSAFLSTLHPSLVPLASPLVDCGVRSLDALASLVALEPRSLDRLVEAIKKMHPHAASKLATMLLVQKLCAAKESNYSI